MRSHKSLEAYVVKTPTQYHDKMVLVFFSLVIWSEVTFLILHLLRNMKNLTAMSHQYKIYKILDKKKHKWFLQTKSHSAPSLSQNHLISLANRSPLTSLLICITWSRKTTLESGQAFNSSYMSLLTQLKYIPPLEENELASLTFILALTWHKVQCLPYLPLLITTPLLNRLCHPALWHSLHKPDNGFYEKIQPRRTNKL